MKYLTEQPSTVSQGVQFPSRLEDDYLIVCASRSFLRMMSYGHHVIMVRLEGNALNRPRRGQFKVAFQG